MIRRFVASLSLCAALPALAVEPGNWELSLVTVMTGQPKPAALVQTRCLTNADARDPSTVLKGAHPGTCEFSDKHDSGKVFTFAVSCSGPLPMEGTGVVTYNKQFMEADLDLTAGGGKFGVRTFVTGRRLGGC